MGRNDHRRESDQPDPQSPAQISPMAAVEMDQSGDHTDDRYRPAHAHGCGCGVCLQTRNPASVSQRDAPRPLPRNRGRGSPPPVGADGQVCFRRRKRTVNPSFYAAVRQRDGICLYGLIAQVGCSGGLEVHHITPRSQGGDDVVTNGILLCHRHHEMATNHQISAEQFREVLARFYGEDYIKSQSDTGSFR